MRKKNIVFIGGILLIVFLAFLPVIIRNWPEKEPDTEIASSDTQKPEDTEKDFLVGSLAVPDIVWGSGSYLGLESGEYYTIEEGHVVIHDLMWNLHAANITEPTGERHRVTFRWTLHEGNMLAYIFNNENMSDEDFWEIRTIEDNSEVVLLLHQKASIEGTYVYLYSRTTQKILFEMYTAVKIEDAFATPELDHFVLISEKGLAYWYARDSYGNYNGSVLSKVNDYIVTEDGIVILEEKNFENDVYYVTIWDGISVAQTGELEADGILVSEGGYVVGKRSGWFVSVDALHGRTENDIKLNVEEYDFIKDINEKYLFFYRNDQHWTIVDQTTGEIIVESQQKINIEDQDAISFVVSKEGTIYLQMNINETTVGFYDMGLFADKDEIEDEEKVVDEVETNIINQEPDLVYENYTWREGYELVLKYGKFELQEISRKQEVVNITNSTGDHQVMFRWWWSGDVIIAEEEDFFTDEYTSTFLYWRWQVYNVIGNNDLVALVYEDYIEDDYDMGGSSIYFYSLKTQEVVGSVNIGSLVLWEYLMVLPEYNQIVFVTHNWKVYVYHEGELTQCDLGEYNDFNWWKNLENAKGKVIISLLDYDRDKTASMVYDPVTMMIERGLEPTSIEELPDSKFMNRQELKGGYISGLVNGTYVIINLADGTGAEPQIDMDQYYFSYDLDESAMLYLKDNGHWRIVEKSTGEVLVKSKEAIDYMSKYTTPTLMISEEGRVYLKLQVKQGESTYNLEFYDIGYAVQN